MFIAIVGTRGSGKSTILQYLVQRGFTPVYLASSSNTSNAVSQRLRIATDSLQVNAAPERPASFLVMNSPTSPYFIKSPITPPAHAPDYVFNNPHELLDFVTRNWLSNFVTLDLNTASLLGMFRIRPFFLVLEVDAPILLRFNRCLQTSHANLALEDFVQEHDEHHYGRPTTPTSSLNGALSKTSSAQDFKKLVHVHVINNFTSIPNLFDHLDVLDILNPEILRPGWDSYFMQLADLASQRSNCMKRRVGAILVRNNRILATGYNGTPRGLTNCNEGGCTRCNTASETSDECVCLHAEENALLEAGRERIGDGSVIYCNTCPCLKCTIKIIQTGVKEVVYSLSYKVDDASASLFKNAGVKLRRHAPPQHL